MRKLLLLFMISVSYNAFSQEKPDLSPYYTESAVEIKPEFPGGMDAFLKMLYNNIDMGNLMEQNSCHGTVSFVVDKDGNLSDVKAQSPNPICAKEFEQGVLRIKTKWKPGMYKRKAVRTRYSMPIRVMPI